MTGTKRDFNSLQNGATLVEFAIVLPLLLLLVLGISEFSFAFYHLNILNKSVQDAALYFSDVARCKSSIDCTPIYAINVTDTGAGSNPYYAKAVNLIKTGNINACDDTTNHPLMPSCANYAPPPGKKYITTFPDANHIQVTATYQHNFMTGNALSNLAKIMFGSTSSYPGSYNLTASSVMRAQ